jgi:hypothetical protein
MKDEIHVIPGVKQRQEQRQEQEQEQRQEHGYKNIVDTLIIRPINFIFIIVMVLFLLSTILIVYVNI